MWTHYHYTRPQLQVPGLPRLEHFRQQIVEGIVYFPRPSQLNDPLDCRPQLVRPSPAQTLAYGVKKGSRRYPGTANRLERRQRRRWAEKRLGNRETLQKLWSKSVERYGVLSLSKRNSNEYLWNAYGAKGTGVCIEYNFEYIIVSGRADWVFFDVEYAEQPPELNILDFQDPEPTSVEEFIRRSFRVKTLRWTEEEEVRVVYQVEDMDPPKVRAPPRTITAMYLGTSISEEDRATIVGWSTGIPIYQTVISSNGQFGFRLLKDAM